MSLALGKYNELDAVFESKRGFLPLIERRGTFTPADTATLSMIKIMSGAAGFSLHAILLSMTDVRKRVRINLILARVTYQSNSLVTALCIVARSLCKD